jgi:phosphoribosylformylglycinamidine synthase II
MKSEKIITTPEMASEHGINQKEWETILNILGRKPTYEELGIFSAMWSEHCSYKSSKIHLSKLPTKAKWVLVGPGENAGVVDIGDGLAVAFKMESHNHPSFIEPYQGAATGVGGILRDVFTMGARPVANLNGLFFGERDYERTNYLVKGVVKGVGDYGNCIGVPTIGGQVTFHKCYNGNILVNAFTLGILKSDRIFKGKAEGVGNPVWYVGSKTGRDGIHGATMASAEFSDETEQKKPTVQVGDPFTEKLLLEACLEIMEKDVIVGIQDMGAAGLTSSSLEMADRAGSGIKIDLSKIPLRQKGMVPYDILLSESQERMLFVAKKGGEEEILQIFKKWNLDAVQIGEVTETKRAEFYFEGEKVADIPIDGIGENAPKYSRPSKKPSRYDKNRELDISKIEDLINPDKLLLDFIGSLNLCSRKWVYRQYDQSVRTNTIFTSGSDCGVIRIKGTKKAVGMTFDVNPRFCFLDPKEGTKLAVAESALNLAVCGIKPLAITDCLNFGNPEKEDVMWEFVECIDGMKEACEVLETPVVSGNVSFYNETEGVGIFPTPSIAMVGIIEDYENLVPNRFQDEGDELLVVGELSGSLDGSLYLSEIKGVEKGKIKEVNLSFHKQLISLLLELSQKKLLKSAHDISDGGLIVAIIESCFGEISSMGVSLDFSCEGKRKDEILFGEAPSRVLISVKGDNKKAVQQLILEKGIKVSHIGTIGGDRLKVKLNGENVVDVKVNELRERWENGFNSLFEK